MTALVVLPGLDGTATLHSAFAEALSATFESVLVLPYPPDRLLDYAALEALARAAFPAAGPFVLLGESFSGPVAISIAANPPPNLKGVVLSTTFAQLPVPSIVPLAAFARFAPVRAAPSALLCRWLLGRWTHPELERALQRALLAVTPAVLRSRIAMSLRADATSCCRAIAIPVLYLRATEDRLLPRRAARQVISAIPHCMAVDIEGPHLLLQAVPQACATAVDAFASDLARQRFMPAHLMP